VDVNSHAVAMRRVEDDKTRIEVYMME
jgi:hypothetical protein